MVLYKSKWAGWESKVQPLSECLYAANRIQSTKRKELRGGRQSASLYSSVQGYRRSQEDTECRSQKSTGARRGISTAHQRPAFPPAFPAAGKDGDTRKSVFVQPLHKYPLSRLCLAKETALDWDSEMIIGGSVLLGAAFINVPINFTCPALFCFH